MMEYWSVGVMGKRIKGKNMLKFLPTFHHSMIPIFHFLQPVTGEIRRSSWRINKDAEKLLCSPNSGGR
jgi:hypothetical protein